MPVSATASFTGGLIGNWSFQYVSGASDLFLQSITIDLTPTNLSFDTAPGGFGSLTSQDICCFGGTDTTTGLTGESASGAALDGGQLLTFYFSNFLPTDTFQFTLDVDHPNPTLTPLRNCTGLTGLALIGCNAANLGINTANNAALLTAQTVLTNAMSNALVTFQFGGTGYETGSFTETFGTVNLRDLINGQTGSSNTVNGNVQLPEPGTVALIGAGLVLLGAWRRKRK
jgi:hypothetical protein